MTSTKNSILTLLLTLAGIHSGCSGCNTGAIHSQSAHDRGANWLFIGDSHSVGTFGDGLREEILKRGLVPEKQFSQFAVSGSSATHWVNDNLADLSISYAYKTPGEAKTIKTGKTKKPVKDFHDLNAEIHPGTILIALGTNDAITAKYDPTDRPISAIRSLLNENTTARCALILPPGLTAPLIAPKDFNAFVDRMEEEGKKRGCLIVDSRKIREPAEPVKAVTRWKDCTEGSSPLLPDAHDGVHFTKSRGEYWGQCVAAFLAENWK